MSVGLDGKRSERRWEHEKKTCLVLTNACGREAKRPPISHISLSFLSGPVSFSNYRGNTAQAGALSFIYCMQVVISVTTRWFPVRRFAIRDEQTDSQALSLIHICSSPVPWELYKEMKKLKCWSYFLGNVMHPYKTNKSRYRYFQNKGGVWLKWLTTT